MREERARIFQPFTRGEDRPSRQGLALALYIAHQVAVAHGGTLEAESTAEETRFTFRPEPLTDAAEWMADVGATWDKRLAALKRRLS